MQIFDSKAIDYLMKLFRGSGDGNIVVNHDSSDPSRVRAKNNDGSIDLLVQNGGERGVYDSTANNESWLIRTDGTDTYLPKGDVKIPGVVDPQTQALSGGNLETAGKVTANGGLETSSISASGGLNIQGSMEVSGVVQLHDALYVAESVDFTQSPPSIGTRKAVYCGLLDCLGIDATNITGRSLEIYDSGYTRRAYIDSSGNIGVGGTIYANDIGVTGDIYYNSSIGLHIQTSNNNPLYLCDGGTVTCGSNIKATSFDVNSDERLKDVQSNVDLTIDDLAAAPSVLFKWKNRKDEKLHGGTIAQYWQKIAPWAVSEDKDGYLSVSYANLALAGVIAIARFLKQYLTRLAKVENELSEMKKEMQQLRAKVNG